MMENIDLSYFSNRASFMGNPVCKWLDANVEKSIQCLFNVQFLDIFYIINTLSLLQLR